MSMLAICPQCGHKNPLGRMFCMQCGTSLSEARPQTKPERSMGSRVSAYISRLIRLVVVLALTFLIALMLWPLHPSGMEGNLKDAQLLQQKMGLLKGAAMDDKTATQHILETEMNAHLGKLLSEMVGHDEAESLHYTMKKVNVELGPGRVVVTLLAALGPINLSYQVIGLPAVEGKSFTFKVQEARLGHLQMPGPLRGWLADRVAVVFSRMLDERSTIEQLDVIEVGQGEVVATHKGR